MGDSVRRIITEILPIFFSKLSYNENEMVHLITFSDDADYYKMRVSDFKTLTKFIQSGTQMLPAIKKLSKLMKTFKRNKIEALRVLTISDGRIGDQVETSAAAQTIAALVQTFPVAINSQAVRWEEPTADTRALSCLLQLNNVKPATMVDSKTSQKNEVIADEWAKLFIDDELVGFQSIISAQAVFLSFPWDKKPLTKIRVTEGDNTVWLTKIPKDVSVSGKEVNMKQLTTLSNYRLHELLRNKYETIVEKLKLLKIINSENSKKAVENIVNYFKAVNIEVPAEDGTRSFSEALEELADDNSMTNMTPEQQAEFLKSKKIEVEPPPYVADEDEHEENDDVDDVEVDKNDEQNDNIDENDKNDVKPPHHVADEDEYYFDNDENVQTDENIKNDKQDDSWFDIVCSLLSIFSGFFIFY
jgi:hypothetical protein